MAPGTSPAARPWPAAPATPADWAGWLEALEDQGRKSAPARPSSWFRLGDACLQVASDCDQFLDELETQYRDCVVARPSPGSMEVRCRASRLAGSPLLCLSFGAASLPDPMSAAGTPFRMLRRYARCAEVPGPVAGWRMLVDGENRGRPLAASDGRRMVIDLDEAPEELATDCVVSVVQAAQPDVLFLHAASFGIAGAGGLLVGWSQAGKSTTALALAARGHSFLGDDVAAIRVRSRELLPFPRAMYLRPGPYVDSLGARLQATRRASAVGRDGVARTLVSVGELFPGSLGGVLPLRSAFFLDGFAAHPRLTPFRPDIADARRLRAVVNGSIPSWGLSPGRDLMRFLAVVDVLSGVGCHLVQLGSPEDSAAAIEAAMETVCHST